MAVKGVDGLLETITGLVLLVAPHLTGAVLGAVATELDEGTSALRTAAADAVTAAGQGIVSGATPLAVFLLVHGVVKLLTVWALLRRALRWYPVALLALAVLFVIQLVGVVGTSAIGGWLLVVLDVIVIVIVLVGWEYRRLRAQRAADDALGAYVERRRAESRAAEQGGDDVEPAASNGASRSGRSSS